MSYYYGLHIIIKIIKHKTRMQLWTVCLHVPFMTCTPPYSVTNLNRNLSVCALPYSVTNMTT